MGKFLQNQMQAIIGSHEMSQSFSTPTSQNFHHVHFITYSFGNAPHFSLRKSWQCNISPQSQRKCFYRTTKELICLVTIVSRSTNDHRWISSSPSKIGCMGSHLLKHLNKCIAFGRTYICYHQTLCSPCRGILVSLELSVIQLPTSHPKKH